MRRDDEPPGPTAPDYMVDPVEYSDRISQWLMSDIEVIDFGEAVFTTSPPPRLGTPPNFLSPEALFELKFGEHADNWALACAIYLIRAGTPPMNIPGNGGHADAVGEIADMLGLLPDSWDKMSFDNDGTPRHHRRVDWDGEVVSWLYEGEPLKHSLIDLVREIEAEVAPVDFHNTQRTNNRQTGEGDNKLGNENESNVLSLRGIRERPYEIGDMPSEEEV
jgi:hypothetical protein